MTDDALLDAAFAFLGTVEQLGAATMSELEANERTAVVRVDRVLHAPDEFASLAGQRITLQLAPGAAAPVPGESLVFFANGLAFGDGIALGEVARRPAAEAQRIASAATPGAVALARAQRHAEAADAVVVARVARIEDVDDWRGSEHDPGWKRATLALSRVERGDVPPGELAVLYPSSHDVLWREAPKPQPGQEGVWILHATEGELARHAPFQLLHPEDFQPGQSLGSP
jgi:hypothetical protein